MAAALRCSQVVHRIERRGWQWFAKLRCMVLFLVVCAVFLFLVGGLLF